MGYSILDDTLVCEKNKLKEVYYANTEKLNTLRYKCIWVCFIFAIFPFISIIFKKYFKGGNAYAI